MNWVLLVVVLIIALCMVKGYRDGFLRVLFSLVEWVVVLVLMTVTSPYVSDFLMNHTALPQVIQEKCIERMKETVDEQLHDDMLLQMPEISMDDLPDNLSEAVDRLEELGVELPEEWLHVLEESGQGLLSETVENTGEYANQLLDSKGVYESLAKQMASAIIKVIANVLTFFISLIIVFSIGRMLHFVNKIPLLGGVNRGFGVLAGALKGVIIVWLLMALVLLVSNLPWGKEIEICIQQVPFLAWMYQNNLIVNLAISFAIKKV